MGIFSRLKSRKIEEKKEFRYLTVGEALERSREKGRKKKKGVPEAPPSCQTLVNLLKEDVRQIAELRSVMESARQEYDSVTAYLMDIEKVELLPEERKSVILDYARSLINLEKERNKRKEAKRLITDEQYRNMERHSDDIPRELKSLQEQESYQQLVLNDIKQLEGEKGAVQYEKEEGRSKRIFLKRLSVAGCIITVIVFMALFAISEKTGKDMMLPVLLTGVMAAGIAAYVVTGLRRCAYEVQHAERKLNRVTQLMNKVKLKYVNCTSALEYSYEKYGINSYHELTYLWEQYVREKDEEMQYRKSSELYSKFRGLLSQELSGIGVTDTEVWLSQPIALLERREMTEVRHRLNERRQKLRDRLDFENRQQDIFMNQIESLLGSYPEYAAELRKVLGEQGIVI